MRNPILLLVVTLMTVGCGINPNARTITNWQSRQMSTTEALQSDIDVGWPSYEDTIKHLRVIIKQNPRVEWSSAGGGGHFKTYQEVVDSGYKGDCEDISAYYYELIRREEIIPDQGLYFKWVLLRSGPGHTVLIIDHPTKQIILNNGEMRDLGPYKRLEAKWDLWSIRYINDSKVFTLF